MPPPVVCVASVCCAFAVSKEYGSSNSWMNNLNRSLENSMDTIPNDRLRFYLLLLAAIRKVAPLWLDVLLSVLDEYSGGLS